MLAGPSSNTRMARRLVILVGAGYLAAQLMLFPRSRGPSWDEAVYLSQVTPGVSAVAFAPSRARGVTFLVAPITAAGGSVATIRLFLILASSAALVGTFLVWAPAIGLAAPVAALLFGSTWLALFYGSEVMPNLWAALLGVAATGALVRRVEGGERWGAPVAATFLGAMALFRPPDALVLFAALALYVVIFRRPSSASLIPLAIGLILGWAPWLIEMSIRFGGPVRALRDAGSLGHVTARGLGRRIAQNLALTNGPVIGPQVHPDVPLAGVVWWGGTVVLALVALVRTRGTWERGYLVCATIAGAAVAAEYLLLVSGLAPRFLLPAYGLLAIPAAAGLVSLWGGGGAARSAAAATVAAVVVLTVWQAGTARRIGRDAADSRAVYEDVGAAIERLAEDRPCLVASAEGYPQVALASGCRGEWLHLTDAASLTRVPGARSGERVFVALPLSEAKLAPSALASSVVPARGGAWAIYEIP
jgi:hypothetical protein